MRAEIEVSNSAPGNEAGGAGGKGFTWKEQESFKFLNLKCGHFTGGALEVLFSCAARKTDDIKESLAPCGLPPCLAFGPPCWCFPYESGDIFSKSNCPSKYKNAGLQRGQKSSWWLLIWFCLLVSEKERRCRVGWVGRWRGSGRSWRRENSDQNTLYKNVFSI